jgi:hypothetical protein
VADAKFIRIWDTDAIGLYSARASWKTLIDGSTLHSHLKGEFRGCVALASRRACRFG